MAPMGLRGEEPRAQRRGGGQWEMGVGQGQRGARSAPAGLLSNSPCVPIPALLLHPELRDSNSNANTGDEEQ